MKISDCPILNRGNIRSSDAELIRFYDPGARLSYYREANSATVLPKDKTAGFVWSKNQPMSTSSNKVQHKFIFGRVSTYCANL
jgi:hypothetical protein